ncbi:MAG: glycosyltransferase, partial [Acidiferrobacter sp.]
VSPRVFVAVGPDWGRHPCSLAHVLTVVLRESPVIWINSIAQRSPRWSRSDFARVVQKSVASLRPRTKEQGSGPLVLHPRALPYHQFASVRSMNGWMIARQLRPFLARFPGHQVVLVATNPAAVALADSVHPDATIYFCMDDYARMQDSDSRLIEVCERLMLARADATVVTSRALVESKSYRGKTPVYIPQAVDGRHFAAPGKAPDVWAHIPHPIIGFQGIIGPRVDLELLEKIARSFPQASLVTIGKEEVDMGRLKELPNVYTLGAVNYGELPSWMQIFDVGLVAYRYDGHTASVNPLKLLEYLALGQEVVSVDLPEMAQHRDYVHLASDHESYLAALARVLARYPFSAEEKARRKAYAARHSWDERAARFTDLCDRLLRDLHDVAPMRSDAAHSDAKRLRI